MTNSNKTCEHCGYNPVPHRLYWYNESLNILVTKPRQWLLYNPFSRFIKIRIGRPLGFGLLAIFKTLHIITAQTDVTKCKVRRAQVMWEEARRRGIVMQELLLFGKPFDVYTAEKKYPSSFIFNPSQLKIKDKGSTIIFSGLPRPDKYINARLDILDDKAEFKKIMQKAGLPIPNGGAAITFRQASKIFDSIQKPVIVKPRAGSRGRHSTTHIYEKKDLLKAFRAAKKLCYWVMVEEQLFGPVFRATVVNFRLEGVLRGDPPQVVGDGIKNIEQLVAEKNSQPRERVKDILLDGHAKIFLSRVALSPASIPAAGKVVDLSEKVGLSYGGSSEEEFEACHEDNKKLFVDAAIALGDPLVGFDFIIPDIKKSYKQQKCGFIEVNTLPFINLHHDPLLGQPRNVAAAVWDLVGM